MMPSVAHQKKVTKTYESDKTYLASLQNSNKCDEICPGDTTTCHLRSSTARPE